MRIDILTVLPDLLEGPLSVSIVKRAIDKGLVEIHIHNLRDFAVNEYGSIDDYQYGGGAGMVMRCEPISDCIEGLLKNREYDEIIYMTPDGDLLDQPMANHLSTFNNIMILCGHYKGVDQRIRERYITREVSIGNYVLSGGEIAAAVLADSIIRLIPGVLGDETSALTDSFQDQLLAPPVYTRPEDWKGEKVPAVLLSGDFKKIEAWRNDKSIERTKEKRPNLLDE